MNIHVVVHYETISQFDSTWWAECDVLPGFTAAAESLPGLISLVEEAAREYLQHDEFVIRWEIEQVSPVVEQETAIEASYSESPRLEPGVESNYRLLATAQ